MRGWDWCTGNLGRGVRDDNFSFSVFFFLKKKNLIKTWNKDKIYEETPEMRKREAAHMVHCVEVHSYMRI